MTSASDFVIFAPMNHFKQSFLLDFFAFFSLKDHVALLHNCLFVSLAGVSPNFASQFSKNPPPRTPDKCDPDLSFDAVSELQQELLFFKGRYGGHHQAWQTRCQLEHPLKKTVAIILCRFRFMWRKHPSFIETGITLIRSLWPNGVPLHLDAVYQNVERNVILFFKGKIIETKVTSPVYVIYLRVIPKKNDCKKSFTSDLQIGFSFLLQVSSIGC